MAAPVVTAGGRAGAGHAQGRAPSGSAATQLRVVAGAGCALLVAAPLGILGAIVAILAVVALHVGTAWMVGLRWTEPRSAPPPGLTGPPADDWATFTAASLRFRVPVALLLAVADTASHFTPQAVSAAGAAGMMQMQPGTFARMVAQDQIPLPVVPCPPTRPRAGGGAPPSPTPTARPPVRPAVCRMPVADAIVVPTVEIPAAAAYLAQVGATSPATVARALDLYTCGSTPCPAADASTPAVLNALLRYQAWILRANQQNPQLLAAAGPAPGSGAPGAWSIGVHPPPGDTGGWNQTLVATTAPPPAGQPTVTGSTNPFPYLQCTWEAYANDPIPGVFGDAAAWPTEAQRAGVTVIPPRDGPRVGEVAVYPAGVGGYAAGTGHVAFITAVHRSAGAITGYTVQEMNVPEGAVVVSLAAIPWPDPHVEAFLPPVGQWFAPPATFRQPGASA